MITQDIQVSEIVPYANNARINDNAVGGVKESIQKYGFNQPLVVTPKDGKYEIVVGHTRFQAIKELGYKSVPCFVLDLPEDKIKQYRIADNSTAEFSSWDDLKLIRELQSMDSPQDLNSLFNGCIDKMIGVLSKEDVREIGDIDQEEAGEDYVLVDSSERIDEHDGVNMEDSVSSETIVTKPVQPSTQIEAKESQEKKAENYRNMLQNIEQERMVKNRQYMEITCPNCGKKFTIAKRGV